MPCEFALNALNSQMPCDNTRKLKFCSKYNEFQFFWKQDATYWTGTSQIVIVTALYKVVAIWWLVQWGQLLWDRPTAADDGTATLLCFLDILCDLLCFRKLAPVTTQTAAAITTITNSLPPLLVLHVLYSYDLCLTGFFQHSYSVTRESHTKLLGGSVVRVLDSGPRGREFDSRWLHFRVTR